MAGTMALAGATCPKGSVLKGGPRSPESASWCEDTNGNAQGHYVKWRPNGDKLLEGEMKDGNREGLWLHWGDDGRVSADTYAAGKEAGYFVNFYPGSCVPKVEGEKPAGIWIWYDEDGSPQDAAFEDADGKRRSIGTEEIKQAFTKYGPVREKVCQAARSSRDGSTSDGQRVDKIAAYRNAKKLVANGAKGALIAKKAESVVKTLCRHVAARTALTQKIERECPLNTEQVGDLAVGTSARGCTQKQLVNLERQDAALKKKIDTAKKKLKPIADDAATLSEKYQADYSTFLEAAFSLFCPEGSTGEPAASK